jgi:intein/homing endonuclease
MSAISSDDVKEYLAAGGKFVAGLALKVYGDSINQAGEAAFSNAIEIGITNTIAALYDADVDDDEIIIVLNKYWGINRDEAEKRLVFEKGQAAISELERYLKMQGFSAIKINQFMKSNNASIKIRHSNELWKLRRKPEKLMKEVQDSK